MESTESSGSGSDTLLNVTWQAQDQQQQDEQFLQTQQQLPFELS